MHLYSIHKLWEGLNILPKPFYYSCFSSQGYILKGVFSFLMFSQGLKNIPSLRPFRKGIFS
jgi:hypothetical protein